MTTGQLILIILLVLVAAVLVAVILRRGSARREEQRVEAADLRSQAEAVAPTVAGRAAFAEQAEQRADVARAEAEEKAREAARLSEEAAEQRRAAEAARQEHEAILRRADDVDPDVKESEYPPVPEDARPEPAPSVAAAAASDGEPATDAEPADDDDDQPMTRAERRRAREEAEARGEEVPEGAETAEESRWASGPAAPVAGAAGAAAVGTAAWAADDERGGPDEERSARIASAADYRDDVEGDQVRAADDVSTGTGTGTEGGMDHDQRTALTTDVPEAEPARTATERADADTDIAAEAQSPTGEWGGPREGEGAAAAAAGGSAVDEPGSEGAGLTMVDDTDAYAATEPVLAEDQAPPVERERPSDEEAGTADGGERLGGGAPSALGAEQGATVADVEEEGTDAVVLTDVESYAATEPVLADGSTAEARPAEDIHDGTPAPGADEEQPEARTGADRYDATPERDWGADEGELLEENRERGDRLAADREALDEESGTETPVAEEGEAPVADDGGAPVADEGEAPAPTGRRVSEFHEIRDGGFGVGSAAPLEDGGQPMGHPIAAYRDTMTFRGPGDAGYEDTDPDVWFYDEGAAERSGFRRSEG
ncbi:MAG TPA: hypothetical protein VFL46_06220 [Phycicoccus sp.]|nr:hypothetical protein [Phycicoccus sp.]